MKSPGEKPLPVLEYATPGATSQDDRFYRHCQAAARRGMIIALLMAVAVVLPLAGDLRLAAIGLIPASVMFFVSWCVGQTKQPAVPLLLALTILLVPLTALWNFCLFMDEESGLPVFVVSIAIFAATTTLGVGLSYHLIRALRGR